MRQVREQVTSTMLGEGLREGGEQPLVLIDGAVVDGDVLRTLSPDRIESIQVIKGEAAMRLLDELGEPDANGVIQIVTKPAISITARRKSN